MKSRFEPAFLLRLAGLSLPMVVAACGDPCLDDGFGRGESPICPAVTGASESDSDSADSGTTLVATGTADADATAGSGSAGGCESDDDCSDPTPACLVETGECVPCVTNDHCPDPALPACDTSNHTCTGCVSDDDCHEPTPVCRLEPMWWVRS